MRTRRRFGAVVLAASLALPAIGIAQADDTPGTQRDGVTYANTAVIHVEGMT